MGGENFDEIKQKLMELIQPKLDQVRQLYVTH